MKKYLLFFALCVSETAFAEPGAEDLVYSDRQVVLTPQEQRILEAIEANKPGAGEPDEPVVMADKTVVITYGSHQDQTILCAPTFVCDIALEPGEVVSAINLGDTARWSISPSLSMEEVGGTMLEVQHVMVKPVDYGLFTNMIVTTGRRTYHLKLKSEGRRVDEQGQPLPPRYMAAVRFKYPENANKQWAAMAQHARQNLVNGDSRFRSGAPHAKPSGTGMPRASALSDDGSGVDLTRVSFSYEMEGDDPVWKPVRIANDGKKTYIYMPPGMKNSEVPIIHVVRDHGGLFTDEDRTVVNAGLRNGVYVVDHVFDEAVMIAGVGGNQQQVRIIRK